MTRDPKRTWPLIAAVVLIQAAALAWMVWDRVTLLKTGREIVLDVVPVDPRSLFRGDYVILSYPISRVPASLLEGPPPERGDPVYVRIAKAVDGWRAVAVSAAYPASIPDGEAVLMARLRWSGWPRPGTPNAQASLAYGIESYFVAEGQGRKLEDLVRDKKLAAVVAVGANGRAAIKGLAIDGRTIYDEPLF